MMIGVHISTVNREFDRNIGQRNQHSGKYVSRLAQNKTIGDKLIQKGAIRPRTLRFSRAAWV